MSGDIRALPDYVSYISGEQHIFAELLNVLEVANRYNIDIDHILQHFEPQITAYRNQEYTSTLTEQQVIHEETVRFWYKLAKYNLYKGRYLYGFKCLIEALKKAGIINHALLISNCAGLFFRFSELATPEMQAQFHSAYEEVWKRNDQEDGFSFGNN